jgi:hypothetical protein
MYRYWTQQIVLNTLNPKNYEILKEFGHFPGYHGNQMVGEGHITTIRMRFGAS